MSQGSSGRYLRVFRACFGTGAARNSRLTVRVQGGGHQIGLLLPNPSHSDLTLYRHLHSALHDTGSAAADQVRGLVVDDAWPDFLLVDQRAERQHLQSLERRSRDAQERGDILLEADLEAAIRDFQARRESRDRHHAIALRGLKIGLQALVTALVDFQRTARRR